MATPATARAMKPIVVALAIALVVVGVVGVLALRTLGPGGGGLGGAANRLEEWIGSQLVGIANSYLVPQIGFDGLDYEAPGTVHLDGVTLTAPDGVQLLELGRMTVTLAQIPKIGQPIVIERINLEHPTFRLLREVQADGTAGLKGLSPIVRATPGHDESVDEAFRLSNVLRLRRIEIHDGAVLYDHGDGSSPMSISGVTTTITAAPRADEPGWYALDIDSAVGPLARLALVGLVSLDTLEVRIDRLAFSGDLSGQGRTILPPPVQALLTEYEARGTLDIEASGSLALNDPLAGTLTATLRLRDAHVAAGDYQVPLETLDAEATLGSRMATLTSLRAQLLGGAATMHGDIELTDASMPTHLYWTIEGVELRDLLRAGASENAPPKLAGKLEGTGALTTRLTDARGSLAGTGEMHVREGRLLAIPGLTQLADVMHTMSPDAASGALEHKADVAFSLGPNGADVTSSEVVTDFLAARGTGAIGFDGSLDLSINAGPMEKLQSLLGGLGDVLGAMTDRLMKYRIGGTIAAPEVTVAPLGIGG